MPDNSEWADDHHKRWWTWVLCDLVTRSRLLPREKPRCWAGAAGPDAETYELGYEYRCRESAGHIHYGELPTGLDAIDYIEGKLCKAIEEEALPVYAKKWGHYLIHRADGLRLVRKHMDAINAVIREHNEELNAGGPKTFLEIVIPNVFVPLLNEVNEIPAKCLASELDDPCPPNYRHGPPEIVKHPNDEGKQFIHVIHHTAALQVQNDKPANLDESILRSGLKNDDEWVTQTVTQPKDVAQGVEPAKAEVMPTCKTPLTGRERAVLDLIPHVDTGTSITLPELMDKLNESPHGLDESTITGRIMPLLKKEYGVISRRKRGYQRQT